MTGVHDEQPPVAGTPPVPLIRRVFEQRRRAARQAAAGPATRTGPQLVRDAYLSWGLEPSPQVRAAAEAADSADEVTVDADDVPAGEPGS